MRSRVGVYVTDYIQLLLTAHFRSHQARDGGSSELCVFVFYLSELSN